MSGMKDMLGDKAPEWPDLFSFKPQTEPTSSYPDGVPERVCQLFERLALAVAERGFKRYSADAVLHRIRWHEQIERGDADFKCNNNWTSVLARWFMARHPELPKFFETRERKE